MWKKKLVFKKSRWKVLQQLLDSGYSLNEACIFFDNEQLNKLDKIRFYDLYIKNKKGTFYNQLTFFYELFPLNKAIQFALEIEDFKQLLVKNIIKNSMYPLLIFILSMTILHFFASSILPQLSTQFELDQITYTVIDYSTNAINFMFVMLLIVVIFMMLLYVISKTSFYYVIEKTLFKLSIVKSIHSYYFLGYYLKLHECGLSSKNSIEYLLQLRTYKIFNNMISMMNHQLNLGKTLIMCVNECKLLNKICVYTFNMAFQTNLQNQFYNQGLKLLEDTIIKKIKNITIILSVISYIFVFIIVMLMYKLMLVPLDMINQL